ncbi:hypothetical protein [Hydrogenophaga sp. 2FB]|uniref:hypothetical protein n=1 Tax=Hydrogenophaga sp. 2FB TaxID=2502187 RepID=UPI0010F9963A|nr:hypothetical protein [Hydrogenophaga sp. 2FB]
MRTNPSPDSPEGPKRPNPYIEQNAAKRPRQDQVETLKQWLVAARDLHLQDHAAVEDFLGFVATGKQFPHDLATATFVFNELIRCEAYAVFVDVFSAYNQIQESAAEADGTPFKSSWVLELPADWKPTSPLEMIEARRTGPGELRDAGGRPGGLQNAHAHRHFKWTEGLPSRTAGEAMSDFVRLAGGDLDMVMPSRSLATALASPNFRLESLTFHGLPFAPGILNALFAALKDNKTLKHLVFPGATSTWRRPSSCWTP